MQFQHSHKLCWESSGRFGEKKGESKLPDDNPTQRSLHGRGAHLTCCHQALSPPAASPVPPQKTLLLMPAAKVLCFLDSFATYLYRPAYIIICQPSPTSHPSPPPLSDNVPATADFLQTGH